MSSAPKDSIYKREENRQIKNRKKIRRSESSKNMGRKKLKSSSNRKQTSEKGKSIYFHFLLNSDKWNEH